MVLNSNLTRFGTSTKWNYTVGSRNYANDFFKQNNLRRYLLKTLKLYNYSSPLLYSHFSINQNPYSPILRLYLYDNIIYNRYFHERRPHRRRKFKKFSPEQFKIYKFRSRLFRSVRLIRAVSQLRRRRFPSDKKFMPFNLVRGNLKYRRLQFKKLVSPNKPLLYRVYFNRFLRESFSLKNLHKFSLGNLTKLYSADPKTFPKQKKWDYSKYCIRDPVAEAKAKVEAKAKAKAARAEAKRLSIIMHKRWISRVNLVSPLEQMVEGKINKTKRKFKFIFKGRRIKNKRAVVPLTRSQIAFPVSKFFNNVIHPFTSSSEEFKSSNKQILEKSYFLRKKFKELTKREKFSTLKVMVILLKALQFKILRPSSMSTPIRSLALNIFFKKLERLINFIKLKISVFGKVSTYKKKRGLPAKFFVVLYKFFKFNLLKHLTPQNSFQRKLYQINFVNFNDIIQTFFKIIKKVLTFRIRILKIKSLQVKHKQVIDKNLFLDQFISTIPFDRRNYHYYSQIKKISAFKIKTKMKKITSKIKKKSIRPFKFIKRNFSININRVRAHFNKNLFIKDKYLDLHKKKFLYRLSEKSTPFKVDFRKNLGVKRRPYGYHYKRVYPTLSQLRAKYTKSLFFLSNRAVLKYSIYKTLRDLPILNYPNKLYKVSISPLRFHKITHFLYARFIINRLKQRFSLFESFKVLKRFLNIPTLRGYLIKCSGRFTKKQRASTYMFRKGSVPIGTFRAPLDYHTETVRLKYGACCIKIWLHK